MESLREIQLCADHAADRVALYKQAALVDQVAAEKAAKAKGLGESQQEPEPLKARLEGMERDDKPGFVQHLKDFTATQSGKRSVNNSDVVGSGRRRWRGVYVSFGQLAEKKRSSRCSQPRCPKPNRQGKRRNQFDFTKVITSSSAGNRPIYRRCSRASSSVLPCCCRVSCVKGWKIKLAEFHYASPNILIGSRRNAHPITVSR